MARLRTDVCIMTLLILQLVTTESGSLIHRKHSISKRAFLSSPKHTVATVGDEVRLECSTDLEDPMTWHFTSSDGTYNDDIYYSLLFVHHLESRYRMDNSKQGQYTLVIPKVDRGHAGKYRCDDDEGAIKGRAVQLEVIESRPRCDVIGGKSNEVRLNCSIYAVGNLNIILTHPKYKVPQPKKINNNVYSVELEAELARTCNICFTAGSDASTCVFLTNFDEYRPTTTIPASEGTPIQGEQVGVEGSRTTITAVIAVVVVIAILVVVTLALYFVFKRRRATTRTLNEEEGVRVVSDTTPSIVDSQPASPTGSDAPLLEGSSHQY